MKSSALTGTPSDHTAWGLITYWIVNGAVEVASTLGYRDVASVTGSNGRKTVTVVFSTPFTDWRVMFDHMVPAHIAMRVGWNSGFDLFDPAVSYTHLTLPT